MNEDRKAKERERRIGYRMSRCAHFTGMQHNACAAGVVYASLRTEPKTAPACLPTHMTPTLPLGTCEQYRGVTREDAEREIADSDAAFVRVSACLVAIKAKHGKARGLVDSMPCPTGCGGTPRYSIAAYNGHVHGRCSTTGCASWMQ